MQTEPVDVHELAEHCVKAIVQSWQGEHVAVLLARDGDQRSKVPVVFQATGNGRAARQAEGG